MLLLPFCRQLWRFDRCFEFGCVTLYTYHATADHGSTLPIEPERAPPPGERFRTLPQPRCIRGELRERLHPLRNAVRQLWAAFDTMLEHLVQSAAIYIKMQWRIGQRRKSEDALYHKDIAPGHRIRRFGLLPLRWI